MDRHYKRLTSCVADEAEGLLSKSGSADPRVAVTGPNRSNERLNVPVARHEVSVAPTRAVQEIPQVLAELIDTDDLHIATLARANLQVKAYSVQHSTNARRRATALP